MSIPKKRQPLAPGEEAAPSSPRRGHYFDPQPKSESRPHLVKLRLGADRKLELQADRGVFGSRRVDLGTEVLLKEAPAVVLYTRTPPRFNKLIAERVIRNCSSGIRVRSPGWSRHRTSTRRRITPVLLHGASTRIRSNGATDSISSGMQPRVQL